MSIFKDFVGFISKYAGELRLVSGAIGSIVNALPIDRGDKAKVNDVLEKLVANAASIEDAVKKMKEPKAVVIKKSDIETAVKAVLPDILRGIVKEELGKQGNDKNGAA
jgi:hypothetical protein